MGSRDLKRCNILIGFIAKYTVGSHKSLRTYKFPQSFATSI